MEDELGFGSIQACQAAIGIKCSECRYFKDCIGDDESSLANVGVLKDLDCVHHVTAKIVDICRDARLNPDSVYVIAKPKLSNGEIKQILRDVDATVGIPENIAFVKEE